MSHINRHKCSQLLLTAPLITVGHHSRQLHIYDWPVLDDLPGPAPKRCESPHRSKSGFFHLLGKCKRLHTEAAIRNISIIYRLPFFSKTRGQKALKVFRSVLSNASTGCVAALKAKSSVETMRLYSDLAQDLLSSNRIKYTARAKNISIAFGKPVDKCASFTLISVIWFVPLLWYHWDDATWLMIVYVS